ncbi:MAG TPA: hypothetical protein VHU77_08325 [Candidatus Limnocylindria bacterium]|nr:hypothetical protein [Candidatus Limnocylindria bacterium]
MRSVLALLGGVSISGLGLALTLGTTFDLAGVLLIAAGGLVAALWPRVTAGMWRKGQPQAADVAAPSRGSLTARLARGGAERRRAG